MAETKEKNENVKKSKKVDGRYQPFARMFYNPNKTTAVIVEHAFKHQRTVIDGKDGFSIHSPLYKVVESYNTAPQNGGTNGFVNFKTKEGFDVGCNFTWVTTLVNPNAPKLLDTDKKTVQTILVNILGADLQAYVAEQTYEEMSKSHFNMNTSSAGRKLKKDLAQFEADYGIRVENINYGDLRPPKEFNEARLEIANKKAQVEKSKSEGQALAAKLQQLVDLGMTLEQAQKFIVDITRSEKTSTIYQIDGTNGIGVNLPITDSSTNLKTK